MTPADDLRWLVAVVDAGSFRGAAERNNVTAAAVSKRIKLLESRLSVRLLTRTTRQVRLTDAGEQYYHRGKRLLAELIDLEESVRDSRDTIAGLLRVNASPSYALSDLTAPLLSFLEKHPDIEMSLTLDDGYVDVAAGQFDVVIRIGELADSSLIARPITRVPIICCAAPDWLARHKPPESPADLDPAQCLNYVQSGQPVAWTFSRGDESHTLRATSRFQCNNGEVLREAAIAGHGVTMMPRYIASKALESGALVPLLTDWTTQHIDVSAVYPSREYLPNRVSALIDHLRAALASDPPR